MFSRPLTKDVVAGLCNDENKYDCLKSHYYFWNILARLRAKCVAVGWFDYLNNGSFFFVTSYKTIAIFTLVNFENALVWCTSPNRKRCSQWLLNPPCELSPGVPTLQGAERDWKQAYMVTKPAWKMASNQVRLFSFFRNDKTTTKTCSFFSNIAAKRVY